MQMQTEQLIQRLQENPIGEVLKRNPYKYTQVFLDGQKLTFSASGPKGSFSFSLNSPDRVEQCVKLIGRENIREPQNLLIDNY